MTDENESRHMIQKMRRDQSSTASSCSDKMDLSKLPNEVLRLGARIVRELGLEQRNDILGRWMAHHLAEVMQEAKTAEGREKDLAEKEVVNLILQLWSHRRDLPGNSCPLSSLDTVISIIGRLSSKVSPYRRNGSDGTEELLSRVFHALQVIVIHGTVLVSKITELPDDLDAVLPFVDEEERRIIEAVRGWIEFTNSERYRPQIIVRFVGDRVDRESIQSEIAKLEELDPISRSRMILCVEIDTLIETLSELKTQINTGNSKVDGEG